MNKRKLTQQRISTAKRLIGLYEQFKNTVGNPSAVLSGDLGRPMYKSPDPIMFKAIDFIIDFEYCVKELGPAYEVFVVEYIEGKANPDEQGSQIMLFKLGNLLSARSVYKYFL